VSRQPTIIPLTRPVGGRRVLRMEYFTSESGPGRVSVGGRTTDVTFHAGLHVLYLVVDGSYVRIDVSRTTFVAPVCIPAVAVGEPAP
jgi:hypothetical protein